MAAAEIRLNPRLTFDIAFTRYNRRIRCLKFINYILTFLVAVSLFLSISKSIINLILCSRRDVIEHEVATLNITVTSFQYFIDWGKVV